MDREELGAISFASGVSIDDKPTGAGRSAVSVYLDVEHQVGLVLRQKEAVAATVPEPPEFTLHCHLNRLVPALQHEGDIGGLALHGGDEGLRQINRD